MKTTAQPNPPLNFDAWKGALQRPIPSLDGVRGVAILTVLAHQLLVDRPSDGRGLRWLLTVPQAGWVGVQLFFVLSGFLITGILLDTRLAGNRWSSFFMRRALRIFPPYYFLLIVLLLLLPAVMRLPPDFTGGPGQQSWYWLYLANWASLVGTGGISALSHCWSLSVEEQFYLLWPPIVFLLRRGSVAWLCVAMTGVALALRIWLIASGKNPEYAYELTVARMDALAVGSLTALLVRHRSTVEALVPRLLRFRWGMLAILMAMGIVGGGFARQNPWTMTLGHTVLALSAAWLIVLVVYDQARGDGKTGRLLAWAPLRLFGKHSYAIYLFHHPIDMAINKHFLAGAIAGLGAWQFLAVQVAYWIVGTAGLLGIAMLFHHGFERPILSLKRHFEAQKQT